MSHESAEKSYKKILSDCKLIQVDTPRQFNPLGQTWAMDDEIGNGFIWTYYFENLFAIKIHDIAYHKEALVEFVNCTPFVRQYGILFRKWGVFVCQRDNESTTELKR